MAIILDLLQIKATVERDIWLSRAAALMLLKYQLELSK